FDHRLEGLRAPAFLLRVRGVDVVVAVQQPREARVLGADLRVEDRVARGLVHLDREAPFSESLPEELDLVADPFAGEADRGDANRVEQGADELVRALPDRDVDHAKACFSSSNRFFSGAGARLPSLSRSSACSFISSLHCGFSTALAAAIFSGATASSPRVS